MEYLCGDKIAYPSAALKYLWRTRGRRKGENSEIWEWSYLIGEKFMGLFEGKNA